MSGPVAERAMSFKRLRSGSTTKIRTCRGDNFRRLRQGQNHYPNASNLIVVACWKAWHLTSILLTFNARLVLRRKAKPLRAAAHKGSSRVD